MDSGVDAGGEPTPVDLALDALATSLNHLIKIVDDGGLDACDHDGYVRVLQSYEPVRNRMPLVDHRIITEADAARAARMRSARPL